jgi:hypothetical protein
VHGVQQHAPLQRREFVDVLDIGRAHGRSLPQIRSAPGGLFCFVAGRR